MTDLDTDLDEWPVFRPRMGSRSRRASERSSGSLRNDVLAAMRGAVRVIGRKRSAAMRSRVSVRPPSSTSRRVIIKAHYVRMTASGAKAAALHLRYIERDGVEKDGSAGILYSAAGPARAETFEEPRWGEKHQFRVIVSPEDASELDLTAYVQRLVATVEKDLGQRLEWAAVNHFDTEHPHAHVVLRGVDRDGREVRLDRGYISNGLRWRAQELATEELGHRHEFEIRRAQTKEVTQERFTSLDRELEHRAKEGRVEARSRAWAGRIDESTLLARLEHLERLRLADRIGPAAWTLTSGWQEQLRELGSRGDIVKQIHKAIPNDPHRYKVVRPGQALEDDTGAPTIVTGRVASKGLSDELKGSFYAVIETPSGSAVHVPLAARAAEELHPGDIVSLKSQPLPPVRPIDREIAEAARAGDGVYFLEPKADGVADPHARRLRDFERLGLATSEGPNRWSVSANVIEQLEERGKVALPRHRLLFHKQPLSLDEQVRHRGVVWLDGIKPESLAPVGFGAEVGRALNERREILRGLGIPPDDSRRAQKLGELERRDVGRDVAARTGETFVPSVPTEFTGHVDRGSPNVPDAYAVVSDGRRFVVLQATAALRALRGKEATVTRDDRGRVLVGPAIDRDMGR
jgi:type IV secretory pathway VirD2 relaxase